MSAGMIGLKLDSDGMITVDVDKLQTALQQNPQALAQLFAGSGTTGGLGKALRTVSNTYSDPFSGQLAIEQQMRQSQISTYTKQIADIEARGNQLQALWTQQFAQLDQVSNDYSNQASYLTQLANLKSY